eukprot:7612600-Lingulodinium_polyedra.AAC.1
MVAVCWCMEQAGIAELYNTDFAEARELVRQLGVNAQAGRQAPFDLWQQAAGPVNRRPTSLDRRRPAGRRKPWTSS